MEIEISMGAQSSPFVSRGTASAGSLSGEHTGI